MVSRALPFLALLLSFIVSSVCVRPGLGSSGTSGGGFGVGKNVESKDSTPMSRSGPIGTSPAVRGRDPAATIDEREEMGTKGRASSSSSFSKGFAGSKLGGNRNSLQSFGQARSESRDVAATIEEREEKSFSFSAPRSHSFQSDNKRIIGEPRGGMLSGNGGVGGVGGGGTVGGQPRGGTGGYDFGDDDDDDDLDDLPTADDIAGSMGVTTGGGSSYPDSGPGADAGAGGSPGSPAGGGNGPGDNSPPYQQQQGQFPQHSSQHQHHQQPQSHQGGAGITMGAIDASQVSNMPNKQQLYGNNDLSQVDKDYIFEGLRRLYQSKVLPLEIASKYSNFASPPMSHSDFEAKPMVLIIGQYSVGKTSFIRSLVKQDFPGQRIGPEPTTDRFTAIMHSNSRSHMQPQQGPGRGAEPRVNSQGRLIPGHALVMESDKPFSGLGSMGNNFLSKFEGAEIDAPILRNITIIDTPGVLAGEKQRLGRDYDFSEVIRWFAERADMIIVMFDGHKLDISDELKTVLDTLRPHQDKLRVLLNKADSIDTQSLLRVYGALMWSLGKVVQTPEACRIYLGSFWDGPLKLPDNRALLEREKSDLLTEMSCLPANAVIRRINELVKRARSVKVHAYIIHYLKKQMPYLVGKSEKQARLLERLDKEFVACARRYNLPLGDFPNVDQYRKMLAEVKDISDFKKLDKRLVVEMDRVLTHDIPLLLQKAQARRKPTMGMGSNALHGARAAMQRQQQQHKQHQYQQQQYQQQQQHRPHGQQGGGR